MTINHFLKTPGRALMLGAVVAAGVAGLGADAAGAQALGNQYRIAKAGDDSVWVINRGSGEVNWCRNETAPGPKVIDVFGTEAETREGFAREARPVCSLVEASEAAGAAVPRTASISYWSGYTHHHWGGLTTRPFKTKVKYTLDGGPVYFGGRWGN
jgi:hypothetical protein